MERCKHFKRFAWVLSYTNRAIKPITRMIVNGGWIFKNCAFCEICSHYEPKEEKNVNI